LGDDGLFGYLAPMLASPHYAIPARMLIHTTTSFMAAVASARLYIAHPLPHDCLHASQRVLNLGTTGNLLGRELVPAQTAGQIRSELELAQPHLEQLSAMRTRQIDACAPVILEQAVASG
jgi:hypothetical protein